MQTIDKHHSFGTLALWDLRGYLDASEYAEGREKLVEQMRNTAKELLWSTRPSSRTSFDQEYLSCHRCNAAKQVNQSTRGRCAVCSGKGEVPNRYFFHPTVDGVSQILERAAGEKRNVPPPVRTIYHPVYLYDVVADGKSERWLSTDGGLAHRQRGLVGFVFCSFEEAREFLGMGPNAKYVHQTKVPVIDKAMWIHRKV